MEQSLVESVNALHTALVSLQLDDYSGEDCAVLAEKLAGLEKISAVVRLGAAVRAGACRAHRERGFAEVSDWMARVTGSTTGSAKAALEAVAALESHPEAKAALESGELSVAQARELVKTEAAVPGSAAELVEVAKSQSFRTLREQARDRRVRAIDPEELHARQHAAMHHRTWINALGNVAYAGELPPEMGVPFNNILDAETDRLWRRAQRDAKHTADAGRTVEVRRPALAAQALVQILRNGGKSNAVRADLNIVVDLRAWRRGHAHDGEPCHIIGGRPDPGVTG